MEAIAGGEIAVSQVHGDGESLWAISSLKANPTKTLLVANLAPVYYSNQRLGHGRQ